MRLTWFLVLLLGLILTAKSAFGQADTLRFENLQLYFDEEKGTELFNVDPKRLKLIIKPEGKFTYAFELTIFYISNGLLQGSDGYGLNYRLQKGQDTILINYPEWKPGDSLLIWYGDKLAYKKGGSKAITKVYKIASTKASETKPYYLDFEFAYNGKIIPAEEYSLHQVKDLGPKGGIRSVDYVKITAGENTGLAYRFMLEPETVKQLQDIVVAYKGKFLFSRSNYFPNNIFHGKVSLGYVDNLKAFRENKNSEKLLKDVEEFSKGSRSIKVNYYKIADYDTGQTPIQGMGSGF